MIEDRENLEIVVEIFFAGCALAGLMACTDANVNMEEFAWKSAGMMMEKVKSRLDAYEKSKGTV